MFISNRLNSSLSFIDIYSHDRWMIRKTYSLDIYSNRNDNIDNNNNDHDHNRYPIIDLFPHSQKRLNVFPANCTGFE